MYNEVYALFFKLYKLLILPKSCKFLKFDSSVFEYVNKIFNFFILYFECNNLFSYNLNWINYSIKIRKNLFLTQKGCDVPLLVKIPGFLALSLEIYIKVITKNCRE